MRSILLACLALAACTPGPAAPPTTGFYVAPTNEIRTANYEGPTPAEIAGARTITTPELQALMQSSHPVLIDVLDGVNTSIPGAVLLNGAGMGTSLGDGVQPRLAAKLAALTNRDPTRPLVFFCLSQTCWLSHNAVVRAVAAGYRKVYWFRGGRNAWLEAGLPLTPAQTERW
jgi:PQQ-dependent catabolism-associated CXXCW motif protein